MALTKCTQCGKEFSDKANVCPNCGYKKEISLFSKINIKIVLGIVISFLIIFAFIFVFIKKNNFIGKSFKYHTTYYNNPTKDIFDGVDVAFYTIYFKSKDEIIYKQEFYYRDNVYEKTLKYELNKNELKIYMYSDDIEIYNYDKKNNCFINTDDNKIKYCEE